MTKPVQSIPTGHENLIPHLVCSSCSEAIEFYKKAFGAEETVRMAGPDGKIMHAEVRIGDSVLMLGEENLAMDQHSPQSLNGAHAGVMVYCDNVDQWVERAVKAGATVKQPAADMFWGDRYASLVDPFGCKWSIATHLKDMSPAEMKVATAEFMKQMAAQKK